VPSPDPFPNFKCHIDRCVYMTLCCWSSSLSWQTCIISARCNIYISHLCHDASPSVRLSVTEVHWHIIANLARSANLPEGLYVLPSVISIFLKIFFNNFSETNYLKIRWTDFHNLYVEWKHFGCRWSIWSPFWYLKGRCHGNRFCVKMGQNCLPSLHLSLCHSEKVWDNAVYVQD